MAVVVVLTDGGEEESRFWPDEGEGELHSLVMNGEWQDGALCVSTQSEESCSSVPGLLEVSLTLHSAADQQADASSFLDRYKLKLNEQYTNDAAGDYVDRNDQARYDSEMAEYNKKKAEYDQQQSSLGN